MGILACSIICRFVEQYFNLLGSEKIEIGSEKIVRVRERRGGQFGRIGDKDKMGIGEDENGIDLEKMEPNSLARVNDFNTLRGVRGRGGGQWGGLYGPTEKSKFYPHART